MTQKMLCPWRNPSRYFCINGVAFIIGVKKIKLERTIYSEKETEKTNAYIKEVEWLTDKVKHNKPISYPLRFKEKIALIIWQHDITPIENIVKVLLIPVQEINKGPKTVENTYAYENALSALFKPSQINKATHTLKKYTEYSQIKARKIPLF